jgi:hypothetical protein
MVLRIPKGNGPNPLLAAPDPYLTGNDLTQQRYAGENRHVGKEQIR